MLIFGGVSISTYSLLLGELESHQSSGSLIMIRSRGYQKMSTPVYRKILGGGQNTTWTWVELLLMAEILHQFIGSLSHYIFIRFHTSQVVQEFSHQQYHCGFVLSNYCNEN